MRQGAASIGLLWQLHNEWSALARVILQVFPCCRANRKWRQGLSSSCHRHFARRFFRIAAHPADQIERGVTISQASRDA